MYYSRLTLIRIQQTAEHTIHAFPVVAEGDPVAVVGGLVEGEVVKGKLSFP